MNGPIKTSLLLTLFLALALAIASWPGLTGGWIYDDLFMLDSPGYDEDADVAASVARTSDYFMSGDDSYVTGFTYRPVTMFTLVSVHRLFGGQPLPHHITSLLIHLLVTLCLMVALKSSPLTPRQSLLGALVFAFHPCLAEAWVWINGRSDPVAGLGTIWIAVAIFKPWPPTERWKRRTIVLVAALFAVGGKEPGLLAAAVLVVAAALPPVATSWRQIFKGARKFVPDLLLVGLAGLVWWFLRSAVAPDARYVFAGNPDVLTMLARTPLAVALAVETIVSPVPRPMRALLWELHVGWTPVLATLFLATCLFLIALIASKRLRSAALLLGGLLLLAPTTHVADHNWMGFDRFLYMPLMLLVLAVSWLNVRPHLRAARLLWAAPPVLACLLFAQSLVYQSNDSWTHARIVQQPESWLSQLVAMESAINAGNTSSAARWGDMLIDDELPAFLHQKAAVLEMRIGRRDIATYHVETTLAVAPDDPRVHVEVAGLRATQGDWDEALRFLESGLSDTLACPSGQALARGWLDSRSFSGHPLRQRVTELIESYPCRLVNE